MIRLSLILSLLVFGCTAPAPTAAPAKSAPRAMGAASVNNGWPDRRPISQLTLSMPTYVTAKNPNGFSDWWYGDLDHADPAFAQKFRKRFDEFFDNALDRAVRQNAQAILLKDCEGCKRNHANTYGGDPVNGLTDITQDQLKDWVAKAKAKGLGFGFLIRDSVNVNGMQAVAWDAAATFADKVKEAKTLYGIDKMVVDYDSNVVWGGAGGPVSAAYMDRVRGYVGPDVLVIGEFWSAGYEKVSAVAAVMHDPKHPGLSDPPQDYGLGVLVALPNPDGMYRAWYTRQLRRGCIPLMAAGFDSNENAWIEPLVKAAGK